MHENTAITEKVGNRILVAHHFGKTFEQCCDHCAMYAEGGEQDWPMAEFAVVGAAGWLRRGSSGGALRLLRQKRGRPPFSPTCELTVCLVV